MGSCCSDTKVRQHDVKFEVVKKRGVKNIFSIFNIFIQVQQTVGGTNTSQFNQKKQTNFVQMMINDEERVAEYERYKQMALLDKSGPQLAMKSSKDFKRFL